MKVTPQPSRNLIKNLNIIFFVLLAGQLSFLGIILFLYFNGRLVEQPEDSNITIALTALIFGAVFATQTLRRIRFKKAIKEDSLVNKTKSYSTTTIISLTLYEGAALFCMAMAFAYGQALYIGLACVLIIAQFLFKPSQKRMISLLQLSREEVEIIEDPQEYIAEVSEED